jgi:carboxymethylenebutenolidase
MGGHWGLWLSQRPELPIGATVTFYGARSGDYANSRAAFMGHFADHDEWVSSAALKKLEKSIKTAGRMAEFHIYPNTHHWFFESDRKDVFDPQAAELAWERTIKFLRKHVK